MDIKTGWRGKGLVEWWSHGVMKWFREAEIGGMEGSCVGSGPHCLILRRRDPAKFVGLILAFRRALLRLRAVFRRLCRFQGKGTPLNGSKRRIAFKLNMNKTIETLVAVNEANIGRLAYQFWENAGCPAGRDLEFWLAAEAKVRTSVTGPVASGKEVPSAASSKETAQKASRAARGGIKKTWPKPYPSLPRF
jgi:hypothetical protein